VFKAKLCSNR